MNVTDKIIAAETVTLTIRGQEKQLPIDRLPGISPRSKAIFAELGEVAPDALARPLRGKAILLNNKVQELQDAKDHSVRDKIFGLLRAALYVAVVAGGVLGTMALCALSTPAAPIALAFAINAAFFGTLGGAFALASWYSNRINLSTDGGDGAMLFWALLLAPAFTIYEEFGKISRLKNQVSEQKQALEALLAQVVPFLEKDLSPLQKALQGKIQDADMTLKGLRQLPIVSEDGQREVNLKKGVYETALEELNQAILDFQSL